MGNCVGKRNYKYFLRFVVSVTVYATACFAVCVTVLVEKSRRGDGEEGDALQFLQVIDKLIILLLILCLKGVAASPTAFALALFTLVAMLSLHSLCWYHMYLLHIGQTTNENLRGRPATPLSSRSRQRSNGCAENTIAVCCGNHTSAIGDMHEILADRVYIENILCQREVSAASVPRPTHLSDSTGRATGGTLFTAASSLDHPRRFTEMSDTSSLAEFKEHDVMMKA